MSEWKRYRSHKIVEAAPIFQIVDAGGKLTILVKPYGDDTVEAFHPTEQAMIARAKVGDFAMWYPDGYASVSPKAAFDEGYTLVAGP